ncbi:PTS lactose/cellobiose transporter subunit IIA, partial [Collinsella intestinalis]|nr:PTS lactose/cellobiose transporter subunit IIA [Collinsella intestinalis]
MAEENESMEMISFGIVASAGQARSLAMEAIKTAREGDVAAARKL